MLRHIWRFEGFYVRPFDDWDASISFKRPLIGCINNCNGEAWKLIIGRDFLCESLTFSTCHRISTFHQTTIHINALTIDLALYEFNSLLTSDIHNVSQWWQCQVKSVNFILPGRGKTREIHSVNNKDQFIVYTCIMCPATLLSFFLLCCLQIKDSLSLSLATTLGFRDFDLHVFIVRTAYTMHTANG